MLAIYRPTDVAVYHFGEATKLSRTLRAVLGQRCVLIINSVKISFACNIVLGLVLKPKLLILTAFSVFCLVLKTMSL